MPIDPSILLQSQGPQIQNPLDAMSKVMSLRQLSQQTQAQDRQLQDQQAMRDAYRNNMTVAPDGTPTINRQGFMSQLGQQNPMLAMQQGQEFQAQDVKAREAKLDLLKKQTDSAHELSMMISPDGANWTQVRQKGIDLGLPNSDQLPEQFPGPQFVQHMQFATMSAKDQIAQARDQQELDLRRQDIGLRHDKQGADKQGQAMQQTMQLLTSARGDPAVAQAEKDVYAGQKLNSLVNLYGDPNKLSPQQVQMAASEVAKIATGGVPTSHELQGLVPSTIPSKLASLAQAVSNNPTGAQAGEFLKQYQDYANSLTKDAQDTIKNKYGRVIESNKRRLNPDDYESLNQNFVKRFDTPAKSADNSHPQDSAAMAWATANPNDPRAAAIMKLNGTGQ